MATSSPAASGGVDARPAGPVWVGTTDAGIVLLDGSAAAPVAAGPGASFLALHPAGDRLYALVERDPGLVQAYRVLAGPDQAPGAVPVGDRVPSGGAGPCHLLVHPAGGWLYVSHYGDGTLTALALDAAGDLTGDSEEHPHRGSGPHPHRQEGSHAHSATLAPGGAHLVVADLGTDQLRAYPLDGGRPSGPPVLTAMPPGCGPRHVAVVGDLVHVSGELSGDVVTVRWDAETGRGEVLATTSAVTMPPRTGDGHALSHVVAHAGHLFVGVRGPDTVAVLRLDEDGLPVLVQEVLTTTWPRHLTVHGDEVLVAGERADLVAAHPLTPGVVQPLGEMARTVAVPAPMCLLPVV